MNRQLATQISLTLLRTVSGLLFMQAGGLKLFGWFGGMPPNGATAPLMTQTGIGGLLELVGGALMILGLFTRVTAFIISGEMAVAYWQFHAPGGFWPIQNHGEAAVYLCFIFLFFSAFGASDYSLDALLKRRQEKPEAAHR